MKTFPVTIDRLTWSHLIRALGFILGLVSVVATFYSMMLLGPKRYIEISTFTSIAYTAVIFFYGLLLVTPNRFLNKNRVTKDTYMALGCAYILRSIFATITTFREADTTTAYITVAIISGIVLVVVANMKIFLGNCESVQ